MYLEKYELLKGNDNGICWYFFGVKPGHCPLLYIYRGLLAPAFGLTY